MMDFSYRIVEDLDEKRENDLIFWTNNDEIVKKNTSDLKRFANKETLREWRKKGRKVYCLVDKNDLLGIVWFGWEGNGFTLAIRLYGEVRGKGLATDFLKKSLKKFRDTEMYKQSEKKLIWLETNKDNCPARRVYKKCGFKETEVNGGRVTMILTDNDRK